MVCTIIQIFPYQLFILPFFMLNRPSCCLVLAASSVFLEVAVLSFPPQPYAWHSLFNNAQITPYQTSALRVTVHSLTCAYDSASPLGHLIHNLHASLQPGRAGSEELFSRSFERSSVCTHMCAKHRHKEETEVLY